MQVLNEVCEVLEDELKQIVRSGEMSHSLLDTTYKVVDIIKDIKTIEAMENANYGSSYMMPDDYSMSNRRNMMGRNYNMGRYSREDEKEHLLAKMNEIKRQIDSMN